MPVQPFYREEYQPLGGGMSDGHIERAKEDAAQVTEEQQAAAFQQHLRTGLQGMQQVLSQLPPEVAQKVGDPAPFADSDEKRVLWYQGVNQAINQMNMGQQALAGNQAGVDALMPNDPKFGPKEASGVAERAAFRKFGENVETHKTESSIQMGVDVLRDSIVDQESGGNWAAEGPAYQKADGTMASMDNGDIALGRYQILPSAWFSKIGLDHKNPEHRKKFLGDQNLQNEAFNIVIQDGMTKYNGNLDKVLADYYGGPRAAALVGTPAGDKPQSGGMPSINAYVKSVKAKIEAAGGMGAGGDAKVVTEQKPKTAEDFVLEMVKENPDLIGSEKFEAFTKSLGKGADPFKARLQEWRDKRLQLETAAEARRGKSLGLKEKEATDKKIASYVKATKSLPEISHNIQELDGLVDIDGDTPIPGVGWGNKPFKAWFLSTNPESEKVRNAVASIFTRLGHEISGANFTEQEMKRMEDLLGVGLFHSETYFRYAMRRLRSETEMKLRHLGSSLGDAKDEAEARGAVTDTKAPVPDTKPKAADAVSAAKAKYKLDY